VKKEHVKDCKQMISAEVSMYEVTLYIIIVKELESTSKLTQKDAASTLCKEPIQKMLHNDEVNTCIMNLYVMEHN
jgi:hypothetical protein